MSRVELFMQIVNNAMSDLHWMKLQTIAILIPDTALRGM